MTETLSALKPLSDAPEIDFAALDNSPDSHAILRDLRSQAPIARTPMGIVLALRHHHLELVTSDATRQIETETKMMQGIFDGPIFEFISAVMLFANGDTHLSRRTPVSRRRGSSRRHYPTGAVRPADAAAQPSRCHSSHCGLEPVSGRRRCRDC